MSYRQIISQNYLIVASFMFVGLGVDALLNTWAEMIRQSYFLTNLYGGLLEIIDSLDLVFLAILPIIILPIILGIVNFYSAKVEDFRLYLGRIVVILSVPFIICLIHLGWWGLTSGLLLHPDGETVMFAELELIATASMMLFVTAASLGLAYISKTSKLAIS